MEVRMALNGLSSFVHHRVCGRRSSDGFGISNGRRDDRRWRDLGAGIFAVEWVHRNVIEQVGIVDLAVFGDDVFGIVAVLVDGFVFEKLGGR
ncbi:hypothetical protein F0562_025497 [Nyssa sinensis]|uniref:Uncharacterized protein n=1 Tax=Nyssa sinensis TaxID=561372 RepID=A0A5J5B6H4_9ASTE|nr:hypothetical protein F0562_025497 [Nyssa sinensis]